MKTEMHVYRPGADMETIFVDLPARPALDDLRKLTRPILECVHDEHVYVLYQGKPLDMFIDEMSALRRLPVNEAATEIYHAGMRAADPGIDLTDAAVIFGTAILFTRQVWF